MINAKNLSFIFHIAYGGVWSFVFLIFRHFYPLKLELIFKLNGDLIFLSMILSFGMSTYIRELVYKKDTEGSRKVEFISIVILFVLVLIDLALMANGIKTNIAASGLMATLQLFLNKNISLKNYKGVIISCIINITFIVMIIVVSLLRANLVQPIIFFVSVFFAIRYKNFINLKETFKIIVSSVGHLLSGLPFRMLVYFTTMYFASSESNEVADKLYADLLIILGPITIFLSRFVLFNEELIRDKSVRIFKKIGFIILPLSAAYWFYAFYKGDEAIIYFLIPISLLSKEIIGTFLMFLELKHRYFISIALCIIFLVFKVADVDLSIYHIFNFYSTLLF